MSDAASRWNPRIARDAAQFAPALLSLQEDPPAPLPRFVLHAVAGLFVLLLVWATFGRLDIIASAQGRLVPRTYVKIVQPADGGIVQEILVREGQAVSAGQILLRMDPSDAQADTAALTDALALKRLQLRRIQGELKGADASRSPRATRRGFSPACRRSSRTGAVRTWTRWQGRPTPLPARSRTCRLSTRSCCARSSRSFSRNWRSFSSMSTLGA